MMTPQTYRHADISEMVGVESVIVNFLEETSDELAHAECFDTEQRAEIYAILQAIKADTVTHRKTIELLAAGLKEGGCGDA